MVLWIMAFCGWLRYTYWHSIYHKATTEDILHKNDKSHGFYYKFALIFLIFQRRIYFVKQRKLQSHGPWNPRSRSAAHSLLCVEGIVCCLLNALYEHLLSFRCKIDFSLNQSKIHWSSPTRLRVKPWRSGMGGILLTTGPKAFQC